MVNYGTQLCKLLGKSVKWFKYCQMTPSIFDSVWKIFEYTQRKLHNHASTYEHPLRRTSSKWTNHQEFKTIISKPKQILVIIGAIWPDILLMVGYICFCLLNFTHENAAVWDQDPTQPLNEPNLRPFLINCRLHKELPCHRKAACRRTKLIKKGICSLAPAQIYIFET